jgi:PIN domain nuclease of toxin-antitoxin system
MIVLDASALLAYLFKETGHEIVTGYLDDCCISSVNLLEVASRFSRDGLDPQPVLETITTLDIKVVPFEASDILPAAKLAQVGKEYGLSQADRICLGTGLIMNLPVLTADKIWQDVGLDLEVIVFR